MKCKILSKICNFFTIKQRGQTFQDENMNEMTSQIKLLVRSNYTNETKEKWLP
jgi:hypothetical protein